MSRLKTCFPLLLSALMGPEALAQARTISFKQVIESSSKSPEVKSAQANSEAALENYKSNKKTIFMPKVLAAAQYTHLLQEQGLNLPSINTPIGTLNPPDAQFKRDLVIGNVSLVQPILDPENMFYSAGASKNSAEAEKLTAKRQMKVTQGRALEIYLEILELRAKRNALEKYVTNLRGRQPEIRRLYQIGSVSEGDTLKVKLGIDDANQGIREILEKEQFMGELLANILGEDGIFTPKDLLEELPMVDVAYENADPSKREDIQSLDKQLSALEKSKKASRAAYLPKLSAYVTHYYADTNLLQDKDFDTIGVNLTWSIFDGGANLSEARANAEKKRALEQRKFLASTNIQASYTDSKNMLRIKKSEFEERKEAVEEAQRVADIEFRRLKTGKTTVNNLIDAEDVLKDRIEKASLSKVNWYQSWFSAQVASGDPITAPWE